jgi:hypothetical protein
MLLKRRCKKEQAFEMEALLKPSGGADRMFGNFDGVVGPVAKPYIDELYWAQSAAKPIPMNPLLAEMLKEWRKVTRFPSAVVWVFASKRAKGKRPVWGQSIMRKQTHPAIEKLGINKRIGWHTFRHS